MKIAVVGGGINGLCTAENLACQGHSVTLYERGELMAETSSCSSKMLHGGLRYLETFELGLVHEALAERRWWLDHCPELTRAIEINVPVYQWHRRPGWQLGLGIQVYQLLAGRRGIGRGRRFTRETLLARSPDLRRDGLIAAYSYFDGQMDDRALGLWIADRARAAGAIINDHCPVSFVGPDGRLDAEDGTTTYDRIINVAGPWAEQLLRHSGQHPRHHLQWVRGSHLLFADEIDRAWLLQAPQDNRIFFVLPWQGHTLLGTTEVGQPITAPIQASDAEIDYLLTAYNHYFRRTRTRHEIESTFSGVRPLLRSKRSLSKTSREAVVDRDDRLLTVYGGKWTSARSLARRIESLLD